LVLALVGALAYWYFGATVAVPDLKGLTQEQAAAALADADLSAFGVGFDANATGPQGTVAAQDPAPGKRVYRGGAVSLTLAGPEMLAVPDVAGMDEAASRAAIEAAGFAVGQISSVFHDTAPAGQVVTQTPDAGTQMPRGYKVQLAFSKGKDLRIVPNVVGTTQANAEKALASVGLVAQVKTAQSSKVAKGLVISQSQETSGPVGATRGASSGTTATSRRSALQPARWWPEARW